MQDIKVIATLPALSFDFDSLKSWATSMTDKYKDLVVTEDTASEIKADMAELNKNKARVDEARKEAVRRVSEPIKAFEAQIKEVCAIFDTTYSYLGNQVKKFEEAQRNAKRKEVEGIIWKSLLDIFDDAEYIQIPIQDKWLNKGTSLKSIKEDVSVIITKHIEAEAHRKALEQARQDRVGAIESHVKALNLLHSINLSISRFMDAKALSLDYPLADVLLGIEERFAIEVGIRQAAESARKTLASVSEQKIAPAKTRTMSIVMEYELANEMQVKACLESLKTLCVNFGARHR